MSPSSRLVQGKRLPLRRSTVPAVSGPRHFRLNIFDPDSEDQNVIEFQSVNALHAWVKSQYGPLALIRPKGQPPLIFDRSRYGSLDLKALYTIASCYRNLVPAPQHNHVLDKEWGNRCRLRLADWFDEQGVYVVEMEQVLYESSNGGSPMAEWEGVWKGLDDTVYLLECKCYMTGVYSALLCRL
jgi:hypothetical protein